MAGKKIKATSLGQEAAKELQRSQSEPKRRGRPPKTTITSQTSQAQESVKELRAKRANGGKKHIKEESTPDNISIGARMAKNVREARSDIAKGMAKASPAKKQVENLFSYKGNIKAGAYDNITISKKYTSKLPVPMGSFVNEPVKLQTYFRSYDKLPIGLRRALNSNAKNKRTLISNALTKIFKGKNADAIRYTYGFYNSAKELEFEGDGGLYDLFGYSKSEKAALQSSEVVTKAQKLQSLHDTITGKKKKKRKVSKPDEFTGMNREQKAILQSASKNIKNYGKLKSIYSAMHSFNRRGVNVSSMDVPQQAMLDAIYTYESKQEKEAEREKLRKQRETENLAKEMAKINSPEYKLKESLKHKNKLRAQSILDSYGNVDPENIGRAMYDAENRAQIEKQVANLNKQASKSSKQEELRKRKEAEKLAKESLKAEKDNTKQLTKNTSAIKGLMVAQMALKASGHIANWVGKGIANDRAYISAFTHAGMNFDTGYQTRAVASAMGIDPTTLVGEIGAFAQWKNLLGTPAGVEEYNKRALFFNSSMQGSIAGYGDFSLKNLQRMDPVRAYQYIGMGIAKAMRANPADAGAIYSAATQQGFGEYANASLRYLRNGIDPVSAMGNAMLWTSVPANYERSQLLYKQATGEFGSRLDNVQRSITDKLYNFATPVLSKANKILFGRGDEEDRLAGQLSREIIALESKGNLTPEETQRLSMLKTKRAEINELNFSDRWRKEVTTPFLKAIAPKSGEDWTNHLIYDALGRRYSDMHTLESLSLEKLGTADGTQSLKKDLREGKVNINGYFDKLTVKQALGLLNDIYGEKSVRDAAKYISDNYLGGESFSIKTKEDLAAISNVLQIGASNNILQDSYNGGVNIITGGKIVVELPNGARLGAGSNLTFNNQSVELKQQ